MSNKLFFLLLAAALPFISCTDDRVMDSHDAEVPASIRVTTGSTAMRDGSRAVITGTYLPDEAQIGTSIRRNSDGTVYNDYSNNCWTAAGTGSSQTWSTADEVTLGVTRCTCYGYYPYNPEVTDLTSVPIEVASQTDYMYAHPYPDFWMGYPEAELTMHHALAVMRVTVKAGSSFTGTGDIQAFNMTGEFPATATMNALTGELSGFQGKADAIGLSDVTLTTTGTTIEQIVIPTGEEQTFGFSIRVDDKTYGLNSSYTHTVEQGYIYTYTLTVNGFGITLSNVDIEPWTYETMGAQSVLVSPSVAIGGDTQDIAVSTEVGDDGGVVLTAVPVTDDLTVNEVTLTTDGTAVLEQTLDEVTGIRTVTLTGVNSPCTVNFTGTSISGYNLQATYLVSSSRATTFNLLSASTGFDISSVSRMIVDGTVMTPSASVDLEDGIHTVKFKLADKAITAHMFDGVTSLTSLDYGSGITSIGDYAFNGCTALVPSAIPASVTSIGDYAFSKCTSMTQLTLPTTVTELGEAAFADCTGLTGVDMQGSVLATSLFSGCTALTAFTVPEGVATIADACFSGCTSLAEVELPSTLTSVGEDTFKDCSALTVIYNEAVTAPSVMSSSFTGVAESGTLYVPSDATGYDTWTAAGSGLETWTQDVNSYYTVNLNGQWQSSSAANPDEALYEGVYESFSNYNISSTAAIMTITLKGYDTFTIYIRSYAESNYDYVMASQLDQTINNSTSYSNTTLVKGHTRGSQTSATAIGNYKELVYEVPDDGAEHTITIVYRKDSSGNSGTDKGYLLIKKQ